MNCYNKYKILSKCEQSKHLIEIASSCFRVFSMLWNVAIARGEISLRKWSVQSCTLEGTLVAKMRFVGNNASFSLMLYYT